MKTLHKDLIIKYEVSIKINQIKDYFLIILFAVYVTVFNIAKCAISQDTKNNVMIYVFVNMHI